MTNVYVVNESTTLNDSQSWEIAWALDYQAKYQFGRSGWRSDARVFYAPGGAGARIPAGGWILHLLDTSDVQGALGYHDEDGTEVPYGRVFVQTSLASGTSASAVASHELLEMLVDPHINDTCLTGDSSRLYAKEVGDPAQGNDYDVGAPEGRTTGVLVADFALPAWFDPKTPATQATDYRGALKGPFVIGPQGYMSYIDTTNFSAGWQQVLGGERTSAPPDDRVTRR